jgi:hypothetical protein
MLNPKLILIGFFAVFLISLISLSLFSESIKQTPEQIIFTAFSSSEYPDSNNKFPKEAKIFSFDISNRQKVELTPDFYSARSPEVSYDGSKLLFSAQRNVGDTWQIWELELSTLQYQQITSRVVNCTDPAYLPQDRIVFSSHTDKMGDIDGVMALFTIKKDGTAETQITFHPNNDQSPTVLRDGRILINTMSIFPESGSAIQLVLRPDGAKAEMLYKPTLNNHLLFRGWEDDANHLVFIEGLPESGSRIVTIDLHRPKYSEINLSTSLQGNFYGVFPVKNGQYLVSYQPDKGQNFGIYTMKAGDSQELQLVYASTDFHLTEPVMVMNRVAPKNLPSRIVEGEENGSILCLDADLSQDSLFSSLSPAKTVSVEVQGLYGSLGRVPVSADGSFYVEVPSNEPIRFQTFNSAGQLLRGPSDWLWVRPKERRGCVGCHEDKELAPENRVPLAVKKKPINLVNNLTDSTTE